LQDIKEVNEDLHDEEMYEESKEIEPPPKASVRTKQ
jgi:hypothetical protein